jgi:hypothetical protein
MALDTLIYVVVIIGLIVLVAYACFYIIQRSIPPDMQMIARLVVGVIALICLVYVVVHLSGIGAGHPLLR